MINRTLTQRHKEPEVSRPIIEVKLRALSQRRILRVQVRRRENAAPRLNAKTRVKEQLFSLHTQDTCGRCGYGTREGIFCKDIYSALGWSQSSSSTRGNFSVLFSSCGITS